MRVTRQLADYLLVTAESEGVAAILMREMEKEETDLVLSQKWMRGKLNIVKIKLAKFFVLIVVSSA